MPLAQSPLREDELVTAHQAQRFVQRRTGAWRKNYVGERAPGGDRLDRPASAESTGEKILKWSRHQRDPLLWRMELISLSMEHSKPQNVTAGNAWPCRP